MSIPVNGGKGGHAEDIHIDFFKEPKEDVVFWEDFVVIAKIIGLNWPRKEIRNWVECNWGKRTITKFIAKGFFVVLFEKEEERNIVLTERNWFILSHAIYIQPWAPHFDPTPLAVYSEPVWIRLYNLPIEYWSEELWEKIGITLGTLLEADFDDVEDICKCARMKIAAVKKIPERVTLVSEFGEWSQKVEIDKEISRCLRCGSKFHGEQECKMFVRKANKIFRKPLQEIKKITEENAVTKIGEIRMKEIKAGTCKGNPFECSINLEEVFRDSVSKGKGLSDTEFEYERGSDDEPYIIDELENIDPRSISQSANVLLGKQKE
ncbi:hypothetical protein SUGI_0934240 [Cryptomeria japonica]|nr:hypothetical protein SUGI_0934240 [Cryptomeria japonica]